MHEKKNNLLKKNFHFQDAFSLLAYSNPWASPLGWQLCPSRRETICAALNSAILGKFIYLFDTLIAQLKKCLYV